MSHKIIMSFNLNNKPYLRTALASDNITEIYSDNPLDSDNITETWIIIIRISES